MFWKKIYPISKLIAASSVVAALSADGYQNLPECLASLIPQNSGGISALYIKAKAGLAFEPVRAFTSETEFCESYRNSPHEIRASIATSLTP